MASLPGKSGKEESLFEGVKKIAQSYNPRVNKRSKTEGSGAPPAASRKSSRISGVEAGDISINRALKDAKEAKKQRKKRTKRLDSGLALKIVDHGSQEPEDLSQGLQQSSQVPIDSSQGLEQSSQVPGNSSQEPEKSSQVPGDSSQELDKSSQVPWISSQELEDSSQKPGSQVEGDLSQRVDESSQRLENSSQVPLNTSQLLEDSSQGFQYLVEELEDLSQQAGLEDNPTQVLKKDVEEQDDPFFSAEEQDVEHGEESDEDLEDLRDQYRAGRKVVVDDDSGEENKRRKTDEHEKSKGGAEMDEPEKSEGGARGGEESNRRILRSSGKSKMDEPVLKDKVTKVTAQTKGSKKGKGKMHSEVVPAETALVLHESCRKRKDCEKDSDIVSMKQPGPLDIVHPKKRYVFDASKGFASTCSPGKIVKLVEKLTAEQRQLVEEIGFGGLLKLRCDVLPKNLARELVLEFNVINNFLLVGADKVVLTVDDVFDVLGLPIGGERVREVSKAGKKVVIDETVRNNWKEEFGVDAQGEISSDKLLSKITVPDVDDKVCLGAEFKKYFVMYVVVSFLNPHARSLVDLKLVDALEDVDKIPSYDWCRYVFEKFLEAVKSFKSTTTKSVNGCLFVPLLCFLHRFPLRGELLPCDIPLLMHWESRDLVKTCDLVMSTGFNNMLKSSQSFPLTCKGKLLSSGLEVPLINPRKSSSTTVAEASRTLSFEIPEDLLTDCQIAKIAKKDVPRALSLQFHRNVEIMARVYLADMQRYLKFDKMLGKEEEFVVAVSQKYFQDARLVKDLNGKISSVIKNFASSSDATYQRSPRIGPAPSFDLGIDQQQCTEDDLLIAACDEAERDANAKKKAAGAGKKTQK